MRIGKQERRTRETEICVTIDLDGSGKAKIATGVGFLDHMDDLTWKSWWRNQIWR